MGIFSEEFKFHSTLRFISRFGLKFALSWFNQRKRQWCKFRLFGPVKEGVQFGFTVLAKNQCLWQISKRRQLVWIHQSKDMCSIGFTVFMRLIGLFGLTAALLRILNKTGLLDQCCFILVIYYSEIEWLDLFFNCFNSKNFK